MPALLLQILVTPLLAVVVVFLTRRRIGHFAGWLTAGTLLYTTLLVLGAAVAVSRGGVLVEEYLVIAPGITLGLMADGLSSPTLGVIMLLCTALAFYSIRYIRHYPKVNVPSGNGQTSQRL